MEQNKTEMNMTAEMKTKVVETFEISEVINLSFQREKHIFTQ